LREKKKILILCSTGFFANSILKDEINYLGKSGYNVELGFTFLDDSSFDNINCKKHNIYFGRRINLFLIIYSFIKLVGLIKKNQYEVVHTHNHVVGIIGRVSAKIVGVNKIIHTAHGFFHHERMAKSKYYFFFFIEKFVGTFTDLVFIESKEDFDQAINSKMLNPEKVIEIGGGINFKNFEKTKSSVYKHKVSDRFVIGINARITIEKGYRELIHAFSDLHKNYPNLYLIIIGANLQNERDPFYEQLKHIIEKNNLTDSTLISFNSNKIPDLLAKMDVFILPSHREGYPRSIMEAMYMKLPVITTNIRGCREEVIHEYNGILIEPKDTYQLKKAIIRLLENKNERLFFGQNSYKRALRLFNQDVLFKKIKKGYKNIL